MRRRDALRLLGPLAIGLGPPQWAWGTAIVSVRVWPAADYTRVTIESDQALSARHLLTEDPPRLVVDIDNLELNAALRELVGKIAPNDPYIAGVRVGQNQPRVVRLVLDLKQSIKPQQFALAPVAAYQHRLVFDLYPAEAPDPLLALIRDKLQAEKDATASVQDALGDFIGKVDKPMLGQRAPKAAADAVAKAASADTDTVVATAPRNPRPTAAQRERINRLIVVTLDPGHGGEDPGAIGPSGLREKDVVLAIALQLRERLNSHPGMRAMLTRDADFFVPLQERVVKARRVQADLFMSIHADAFFTPAARGASVFALSDRGATSTAARWMAQKENAADLVGGVNVSATRDTQVLRTLLDMSTTAQIKDSLRAGKEVLTRIGGVGRLHKGAVEQAGFAVLKAPDIPSILVETAFISNPEEEDKLRDADYQHKLVEALFAGIDRYFARHPPLARNREL